MSQDTNTIINTLGKMRLKKSVSLSVDKKASILRSVYNTSSEHVVIPRYKTRVSSPFMVLMSQYVLPMLVLFFVGTQFGDTIVDNTKVALTEFNSVKSDIQVAQKSAELKNSLSIHQKEITALKSSFAANVSTGETGANRAELIASVTTRSRDIQNQVASLVKENKITEAKQIVLTLETALKADELYKVATSVSDTVFSATDLRLDIERKETEATTTVEAVTERVELAKKTLVDIETNASTTDLVKEAYRFVAKAEEYVQAGDIDANLENAIISLQTYDRILAEIRLILLP